MHECLFIFMANIYLFSPSMISVYFFPRCVSVSHYIKMQSPSKRQRNASHRVISFNQGQPCALWAVGISNSHFHYNIKLHLYVYFLLPGHESSSTFGLRTSPSFACKWHLSNASLRIHHHKQTMDWKRQSAKARHTFHCFPILSASWWQLDFRND